MTTPRVEFLWWRECPSWERALADLRAAMAEAGLDPDSIELREIDTEDLASREAFVGSPTIRVDGEDIRRRATTSRSASTAASTGAATGGSPRFPTPTTCVRRSRG